MFGGKCKKISKNFVSVIIIWSLIFSGLALVNEISEPVGAAGPTNVSGLISTNTTWTTANSPYHIIGDTTLMVGRTLNIQAGVVIKFANNTKLRIRGTLDVDGTNTNKVIFTNLDPIFKYSRYNDKFNLWHTGSGTNYIVYVESDNGGVVNIDHAKFEYSSNCAIFFEGYDDVGGQDIICNSTFENNYYAFGGGGDDVLIKDSTFKYNEICVGNGTKIVDSCLFQNNTFGLYFSINAYNSVFIGNYIGTAVYESIVKYCEFTENEIGISKSPINSIGDYYYNSVYNNKIGVNFGNYGTYTFENNNIYNNTDYNLKITGPDDQEVKNNWWGTNDPIKINQSIYDIYDDISLGEAVYKPYLSSKVDTSNQPPIADAGKDKIGAINQNLFFDGSGSHDPYGDPIKYKWDFGDGNVTNWGDKSNFYHSYAKAGSYNASISVYDGLFFDKDYCIVKISYPPIPDAGPDQNVTTEETVYLSGIGSYDPDDDPLKYFWYFGDGTYSDQDQDGIPDYTENVSAPVNITHSYTEEGNYTVELTITDGFYEVYDTCIIHVLDPQQINNPPVADAGPDQNAIVNETVYFDGSGSYDPDGDPLLYNWDFGDGDSTNWQSYPNTTHTYYAKGDYNVTLSVLDNQLVNNDTCIVHVTEIKKWGPNPIHEIPNFYLDEDAFLDNTLDLWEYYQDYDTPIEELNFSIVGNTNPECGINIDSNRYIDIYPDTNWNGDSKVSLMASDGEYSHTEEFYVYVRPVNDLPIADAGPDHYIQPGQTVNFNGSGSYDIESDQLMYKWNTQGTSTSWSEVSTYSRTYLYDGQYTVTLFVTDGELTDHDNCTVYVTEDGKPPNNGTEGNDTDGDGLPDDWETDNGLDPYDANDAMLDNDGDELTNLEEFEHGTDPNHKDTDGDGIPDGWEVQYDLNPTDSSDASFDFDNDKLTNLQEFEKGTDPMNNDSDNDGYADNVDDYPTDPDKFQEKIKDKNAVLDTFYLFLIGIIVIIILIILTVALLISRAQRFGRQPQPSPYIDARHELRENGAVREFQPEPEFELAADEDIMNLKTEALGPDKPSELGPSQEELLAGFKEKIKKGELSQSTYDAIQASLGEPKP
jgi:PKD repeat protein